MKKLVATIFAWCILLSTALAQNGKITGYMFGDLYWVAGNHDKSLENQNGLGFRRIYFTYDDQLGAEFSVRLRLEMNSPGDFTTKLKLSPTVKDAYLRWKTHGQAIYLGISSTPTWEFVEKVWGYRSVEKTPIDLHKLGSSRETGVAVRGPLGDGKCLNYHLMIGNGNSNSSENNKGKKLLGALRFTLSENVDFEVYGDWDDRPGKTDRYTGQAFLSYRSQAFRAGAQYVTQTRQTGAKTADENVRLISAFAAARLGEKTNGFARIDRLFDANPDGAKIDYLPMSASARAMFLLFGLEFSPEPNVHFMPNIELVSYSSSRGPAPDSDIIPRLTFYYEWK